MPIGPGQYDPTYPQRPRVLTERQAATSNRTNTVYSEDQAADIVAAQRAEFNYHVDDWLIVALLAHTETTPDGSSDKETLDDMIMGLAQQNLDGTKATIQNRLDNIVAAWATDERNV